MFVKVAQSDFYNALQAVQRGAAAQSTLPILTGIKISADQKDSISLHSTDLELSMKVSCQAKVEKKGALVATGKLLVDIFRFLPDGTVSLGLENDGKQLHINTGRSSFKVQTMPVEDFPAFPDVKEEQAIEVGAPELQETIKQTSRAISKDETRPVLTGALFKISENSLLVVATDSYRLAYKSTEINNPDSVKIEVLVPHKAVDEILKLVGGAKSVRLATDNNLLKIEADHSTVVTRLIEGQFPNYDQLIPKESKLEVRAKKEDLAGAISQASLMAQKNMSIKIVVKDGELSVSAATAGVGEADTVIKAKTSGETIGEMAFNAQYLLDGIQSAPGEELLLEFNGSVNPGLVKSITENNYMYLIMPIRIS